MEVGKGLIQGIWKISKWPMARSTSLFPNTDMSVLWGLSLALKEKPVATQLPFSYTKLIHPGHQQQAMEARRWRGNNGKVMADPFLLLTQASVQLSLRTKSETVRLELLKTSPELFIRKRNTCTQAGLTSFLETPAWTFSLDAQPVRQFQSVSSPTTARTGRASQKDSGDQCHTSTGLRSFCHFAASYVTRFKFLCISSHFSSLYCYSHDRVPHAYSGCWSWCFSKLLLFKLQCSPIIIFKKCCENT